MSGLTLICSTEQIAIRDPLPRNSHVCTQNYTWVSGSSLVLGSSSMDQFKGPRLYLISVSVGEQNLPPQNVSLWHED